MRKLSKVLLLAVLVAALGAPLWFAASFESASAIARRFDALVVPTAFAAVIAPVSVTDAAGSSTGRQRFDAAALLMTGTLLFGLAAVVRRTL